MARPQSIRSERGQATVEHVGLTLLIALLLAALGLWVASEVRPPDHLPDVIGRVSQPILGLVAPGASPWATAATGAVTASGDDGQPSILRRAWDAALAWGRLNVDAQVQAAAGFVEQMRGQAEQVMNDPLGTGVRVLGAVRGVPIPNVNLSGAPPPSLPGPNSLGEQSLAGYLWDIGHRPLSETFVTLARVAGRKAADWVLLRIAKVLGGKAIGGMRRP